MAIIQSSEACTSSMVRIANPRDRFQGRIKSVLLEKHAEPGCLGVLQKVKSANKENSRAQKIRNKLVRLINNIGQVYPYTCRRTDWQEAEEATGRSMAAHPPSRQPV